MSTIDKGYKELRQCLLRSGTTRMVAYVPADRALDGATAVVSGRRWEIYSAAKTGESSRYIAWYLPFSTDWLEGAP